MRVLLLAGTGEAAAVAREMAARDIDGVASLAGAVKAPKALALPTRVGGFGGEAGFRAFLEAEGITAVLDATHPYAARISARTARVCGDLGLPYCQVLRPEWSERPGEDWVHVQTPSEVADVIPKGAVVFLATGRQSLQDFAGLGGRRVLARVVDAQEEPFPIAGGAFIVGKPSSNVSEEAALLRRNRVEWLVTKNAGGSARAKLEAAREVGAKVIMIARPPQPEGVARVADVAGALAWLEGVT